MELPQGMEEMVFSFAHYRVKDFDRILSFLKGLEKEGLFAIDEVNAKSQRLSGAFLMPYPKGHWNPLSKLPGAKQVIGGTKINGGHMEIDAKTRRSLSNLRHLLEKTIGSLIEFEREEFQDVMGMLRKK